MNPLHKCISVHNTRKDRDGLRKLSGENDMLPDYYDYLFKLIKDLMEFAGPYAHIVGALLAILVIKKLVDKL